MVPGFSGQLISGSFLESHVSHAGQCEPDGTAEEAHRIRRELVAWRRRCRHLGPASSLRTLFDAAAAPLVELLGFELSAVVPGANGLWLGATIRAGSRPLGLVVTTWGERLDAFWRVAVTHALGLGGRWCLLFNGTQCRLIDALRVYARRYIEFDLELAVEDDRAFAAFWWAL